MVDFIDGERIIRADELSQHVYLIISGQARMLGQSAENNELITIDKVGKGSTFGWVGVLRGEPCETINASRSLMTVRIKIQDFVELIEKYEEFRENFENNYNKQEAWHVMTTYCRKNAFRPDNLNQLIKEELERGSLKLLDKNKQNIEKTDATKIYYTSTRYCDKEVGTELTSDLTINHTNNFRYRTRLIELDANWKKRVTDEASELGIQGLNVEKEEVKEVLSVEKTDLLKLGVIEHEEFRDEDKYPLIRGRGVVQEGLAILEMVCLQLKLPFRKEICKKYLTDQKNRGKELSIESIGGLCEILGCSSQIGVVSASHLDSVDYPAIHVKDGHARIIWGKVKDKIIVSDPNSGLKRIEIGLFSEDESIKLILVKRSINANTKQFGWNWFTPLVNKYKWA